MSAYCKKSGRHSQLGRRWVSASSMVILSWDSTSFSTVSTPEIVDYAL